MCKFGGIFWYWILCYVYFYGEQCVVIVDIGYVYDVFIVEVFFCQCIGVVGYVFVVDQFGCEVIDDFFVFIYFGGVVVIGNCIGNIGFDVGFQGDWMVYVLFVILVLFLCSDEDD